MKKFGAVTNLLHFAWGPAPKQKKKSRPANRKILRCRVAFGKIKSGVDRRRCTYNAEAQGWVKLPGQTILQLVLAKRAIQQSKVPHTKTDISGHPTGSPVVAEKRRLPRRGSAGFYKESEISRSSEPADPRKPCRGEPRRGPSHERCHEWHPGSAPWPSWPARTYRR